LTPGNITDPTSLALVQAQVDNNNLLGITFLLFSFQLDNITATYSAQLSPCRLQLLYAAATSDSDVVACTSLECSALCTGTCFQQKNGLLTTIIEANQDSFTIPNFPSTMTSNTSRSIYEKISRVKKTILIYLPK
jgi:hypothetical protein